MKVTITKEYDVKKEVFVDSCKYCPCFSEADDVTDYCKLGFGADYDREIAYSCPLSSGGSILISKEED